MKLLSLVFLLVLPFQVSMAKKKMPLPTVKNVELERYLGKWYEVASFPQFFQRGCTATTAEYSLRDDGDIRVSNSCNLGSPAGRLKEAEGRAWITNKKTNAKLKVKFIFKRFRSNLFAGNYWILDLDKNYESVLIGDPSRKYLWILSRTPDLNEHRYNQLVRKAKSLNFNIKKLKKTIH